MQNSAQKIEKLSITDLVDISTFSQWVRKHINIYNNKEIPGDHLLLFLDYILEQIQDKRFEHNRGHWLDAISSLKGRIPKYDRFNKRHSESSEQVS